MFFKVLTFILQTILEIKSVPSTEQILKILYNLSWILFIGICVEAGVFIFNAIFPLVLNPIDIDQLWLQVILSSLFEYDIGNYFVVMLFINIVDVMKACLFYRFWEHFKPKSFIELILKANSADFMLYNLNDNPFIKVIKW